MKTLLKRFLRIPWTRLTPIVVFLTGFSSCAIFGDATNVTTGQNVCIPFRLDRAIGFPAGPVTVYWNPVQTGYVEQYHIYITNSKLQELGEAITDETQTSAVITMDKTLVAQTMATNHIFYVYGVGVLRQGFGLSSCKFTTSINLSPNKPQPSPPLKATLTATLDLTGYVPYCTNGLGQPCATPVARSTTATPQPQATSTGRH